MYLVVKLVHRLAVSRGVGCLNRDNNILLF